MGILPKYKMQRLERYIQYKRTVIEHYGGKCTCCGEKNIWFLSIDHVNNDGYKLGRSRPGTKYSNIISKNFPKDLQLLCYNCNQGKNNPINKFVCPHNFA